MGTKTNGAVSKRQSAAEKAREARIKLHRDRDARDGRVEAAAAEVFIAQDVLAVADERLAAARAAAAAAVADAEAVHSAATRTGEVAVSAALQKLAAERLTTTEIAELTSLPAAEVRRLSKTSPAAAQTAGKAMATDAGAAPSPVAV